MKKRNLDAITDLLVEAAEKAGFEVEREQMHVEKTRTLDHGHFSTNIAMLLAGKLGKRPTEVAQAIADKVHSKLVTKVEVAPPGFINLTLEQKFYTTELQDLVADFDDYFSQVQPPARKRMLIDYSHPNIAKPMGVHHLLSTIIGDSIKRTYRRLGWEVIADNFIGDMGTQFGKLIWAIKQWGDMKAIEKDPIAALLKLYVQYHIEADKDVELDDEARAEYRKFEEGDKESRRLWEKIRKWSLEDMQQIYDRLGVEFDVMNGESFYEGKMEPILEEGRKKGIVVDGEGGSWIIKPDDPEDVPVLVRKSDGATLYATRDLARIRYWEEKWHPDLMVNVVDQAQSFYFNQLFFAQGKLDLTSARNVHVSFGRMQFADRAMSTRKGNVLLLIDVLDEAENRALHLIQTKEVDLTMKEQKELSKIMGAGSIKYNVLHQARTTNITFDWDKMLTFEGNSAPYLMYTVSRAKSVLRRGDVSLRDARKHDLKADLDVEKALILQLLTYPDAVRRAGEEFKPNHIANYLYELAQNFNSFYNGNSILQAESKDLKESRLLMTAAVIRVMEDGFGLLGLHVPDRM